MRTSPAEGILAMTMSGVSQLARTDVAPVAAVPAGVSLRPASPGDHHGVWDFLVGVFQAPSLAEYQAQLDNARYEPIDRLILRHHSRIVGHVRVDPRGMRFGAVTVPIAGVHELAVAPEYRRRGLGDALVDAAEQRMQVDGAVVGVVRTTTPRLFARRGWVACGRHCYSLAATRELLAQLVTDESPRPTLLDHSPTCHRPLGISTRIWRHVERGALVRLYDTNTRAGYGPLVRDDEYWRWLISRRGYGEVYVAVEGRDKWNLDETPIVGYAVVKDNRIVEIMEDPRRPDAVRHLLTRIGGDFIERDLHDLRLDAPPNSPLHALLVAAGGRHLLREVDGGQTLMARLFSPVEFLHRLLPELEARAARAHITAGELGLQLADQRWQLRFDEQRLRLEPGRAGRHSVSGDLDFWSQLLLGHVDVPSALAAGRCAATTRTATHLAAVLFPSVPFWHPPLDDLTA